MKNLICLLAVVLSGCSASLVERLSSGVNQWPQDKEPTLRESPTGVPSVFGVSKRAVITNPWAYPINARLTCSSMYQGDQVFHVAPHRERYILITANRRDEYTDSCVMDYTIGWYPGMKGDGE